LANHTVLIAKDGSEWPIDDSGAPIRGPGGEIEGVVLVFRDISDRRAAEIAMNRLVAIVESSDDAIISKNLDGVITSWNAAACRIFGYTADEIIGRSILTIIPPELQSQEQEIISRLKAGERVDHIETVRLAKGGRSVDVSLTISPVKDRDGRIIGASKIARDITERKQSDADLAAAQKKLQRRADDLERRVQTRTAALQQTVAELEAFSYSLSHDMRAPLRAIQSYSQIVLEDCHEHIGPGCAAYLNKVVASAERLDRLILDLLAFTRLSREEVTVRPVDTDKLVRELVHERPEFQLPNADIKIEGQLLSVEGNEASLTQCITNLIDNAVKYVARGVRPQLRIQSEARDGGVRLWFEDNGIGIDAVGQRRLFQMFQRIHGNEYEGTGIGLAIVRKAVERMHGQAGVESEPGKGSRFWLQLPAVNPTPGAAPSL